MKKNFRKVISVICVLALLMSAVSVVLTTSTSASRVDGIDGVWETSHNPSVVVVDEGVNVAKITGNNDRHNVAYANATGDGYYEVEAGKTYFMSCDMKVVSCNATTGSGAITWSPYLGAQSEYSTSVPAKVQITTTSANFSDVYISRLDGALGQWTTVYAYFTVPEDAAYIASGSNHLFATVYSQGNYVVYMKNPQVKVAAEGEIPVVYFDNGVTYAELGKVGDTITRKGQNAVNNEAFMAWYGEPDFTGAYEPITAVPEVQTYISSGTAAYVFARYPSIVIKFANMNGVGVNNASVLTASNCKFIVYGSELHLANAVNSAVMIPAYDYTGFYGKDGKFQEGKFFQFAVGTQYTIAFDYKEYTGGYQFTPARTANGNGERITAGAGGSEFPCSSLVKESTEWKTYKSATFTYKDGTDSKNLGPYSGMCFRATGNASSMTVDNLVITESSEATAPYKASNVTLKDGDTTIDTFQVAAGEVKALPVLKDTDDKIFAGWYDEAYNPAKQMTAYKELKEDPTDTKKVTGVETLHDYAPKACIVGDGKDYSLTARWAAKEVKIDFTSSIYATNMTAGHATNIYVSAGIDLNADTGFVDFNKSPANGYRILLYDANDNPVNVYEGVDYEVTLEYAITGTSNKAVIALGRDGFNTTNNCGFTGTTGNQSSDYFVYQNTAELVDKTTSTLKITAKNVHDYYLSGGATKGVVKNIMTVCPQRGQGTIYSVTVKATGYHPQTLGKNCDINIDYENGVATILPHEGYEFSFGSVKVHNMINAAPAKNVVIDVDDSCYKMGGYDLSKTGIDLAHIVVEAEAVAEGTIENNSKIVASSYQIKQNPDDLAGVRFLNRVTEKTMEGFDNAYFAVVPTALMGGKTMLEYLDDDDNLAAVGVAYDKNESIDIVYAMNGGVIDYQVYLRGLVPELEDVEMTVCFIGVKGTGESVVLGEKQDSYESIFNRVNG